MIVGEDPTHFRILGSNQSGLVNIVRKAKGEVVAVRRPLYLALPAPFQSCLKLGPGSIKA